METTIKINDKVQHVSGFYGEMTVFEILNGGKSVRCQFDGGEGVFPISSVRKVVNMKKADRIPRIYLSGPISHFDINERRRTFSHVKDRLSERGFYPVNPLENGLPVEASIHEHLRRDVELILTCDAIIMMKDWSRSAGCKLELDIAMALGLSVYFEEDNQIARFE